MYWRKTYHTQSTDGVTEHIHMELMMNFPVTRWNKKKERPVVRIEYYDYKKEGGWYIDDRKTKWYTYPPHKNCDIKINYFQSHPATKLYSGTKDTKVHYNDFTIEYCMKEAERIFKERLMDVINQFK